MINLGMRSNVNVALQIVEAILGRKERRPRWNRVQRAGDYDIDRLFWWLDIELPYVLCVRSFLVASNITKIINYTNIIVVVYNREESMFLFWARGYMIEIDNKRNYSPITSCWSISFKYSIEDLYL